MSTTTQIKPDERQLKGSLGTWSLMLTVLAFAAPIAVATGFVPLGFVFAGISAPVLIFLTLVLVIFFVVGYVALTKYVKRPGAFYSYISAGLGKHIGLSSAFLAAASYFLVLVGAFAFTGVLVADMITSFGGPETSWIPWAAISWVIVVILGYLKVDFSVRTMVGVMIFEIALILIFDVGALLFGAGAGNLNTEPLQPANITSANIPMTMVFAILMFIGFEATAIFRDEVKNPDVTIPRATYGAVILVGLLHFITSYSLYAVYGAESQAIAETDPASMFTTAIGQVVAPVFTQITIAVVTTSQFASAIAVHNVVVRYVHTLSRDGALSPKLALVHPKFHSPYRASNLVAALAAVVLAGIVLTGADDPLLYGQLMGIGLVGLILLMALVSLAVVVWFIRNGRPAGVGPFKWLIAPLIAFLGLGFLAVNQFLEFTVVWGGNEGQSNALFALLAAAITAGAAIAVYLKRQKPVVFNKLGAEEFTDH